MRWVAVASIAVAGCAGSAAPPPRPLAPPPPLDARVAPTSDAADDHADTPPLAARHDLVEHEFGIEVVDPYRWMESDEPGTSAFLRAHSAYATRALAALPGRAALAARVRELGYGVAAVFAVRRVAGKLFYRLVDTHDQVAKLMVRDDRGARVLVDPNPRDPAAPSEHRAIHAYSPSPDGRYVAFVESRGGSEAGVLRVVEVATGAMLADEIEGVWGEGAAAWLPDSKRFFYNQRAAPRPGVDGWLDQTSRLHVLGTPSARDVDIIGRGPGATLAMTREEMPGLWITPTSDYVFATVGGAHDEFRLLIAPRSQLDTSGAGKTPWRAVADYKDGVVGYLPHRDRLYVMTYAGAPNRRVVSVPLVAPDLAHARVDVPEVDDATLTTMSGARDALYLVRQRDGKAILERWPWRGGPVPIALPHDGWIPDFDSDLTELGAVLQIETWLAPGSYYELDGRAPPDHAVRDLHLASTADSTAAFSSIAVDEVTVASTGGAQVPLTILHAKSAPRDGARPTILSAYGAYGVSQLQGFGATRLAWLERGGVIAIAHVRGGGERGRAWQDAGSREHKLDGVADLIACAEHLIGARYTSAKQLAVAGGSMGGVVVGRAITLRPELFAAANIGVGIVNPLRILTANNGANQIAELGDPRTAGGFVAIHAMDPYFHVADGTSYPATLFTLGIHDQRVAPWMTAKLAARMLAAVRTATPPRPVWIRLDEDAGHGPGSTRDQAFAERADVMSFYLMAFGDPSFARK